MWEIEFDPSMLKKQNVIISCPNRELVGELMDLLAENGVRWGHGEVPSVRFSYWTSDRTCYWVKNGVLSHGDKGYAESNADEYRGFIMCTFYGYDPDPDLEISTADFEAIIAGGGSRRR